MRTPVIFAIFAIVFSTTSTSAQSNEIKSIDNITYRLYPTENMWTFIKLNTRNGKMWQVQFSIESNKRFETFLNTIPLVDKENEENGRFTLYPTQNLYNFILLDQIDGKVWQTQWSLEPANRGVIVIN
jgi:hypothetical protein